MRTAGLNAHGKNRRIPSAGCAVKPDISVLVVVLLLLISAKAIL